MSRFLNFSQSRGAYSRDRGTFLGLVLLFLASLQEMNLPFPREQEGRRGSLMLCCCAPRPIHCISLNQEAPASSWWPQSPDHLHVVHDIYPISGMEQRGSQEQSGRVPGEETNSEEHVEGL